MSEMHLFCGATYAPARPVAFIETLTCDRQPEHDGPHEATARQYRYHADLPGLSRYTVETIRLEFTSAAR